ncbi:MAG: membrane protein insertion efficiency factor YidD [Bdellovibrionota bacterium]|jgi:putative membrane protein insertion efficiency factor|nr:membrane protein insertion efficiency factor YidD [Bdellovibrionota bacterium]
MVKAILRFLINFYQRGISPFIGPRCRFEPTCSCYAKECLENFSAPLALWYSVKRISKCHPFHPGGYDPIPGEVPLKKD